MREGSASSYNPSQQYCQAPGTELLSPVAQSLCMLTLVAVCIDWLQEGDQHDTQVPRGWVDQGSSGPRPTNHTGPLHMVSRKWPSTPVIELKQPGFHSMVVRVQQGHAGPSCTHLLPHLLPCTPPGTI